MGRLVDDKVMPRLPIRTKATAKRVAVVGALAAATTAGCADDMTEPPLGSTSAAATTASGASAVVVVTAQSARKVDDRAALAALYQATDGSNWIESEGWMTDAPLGDWHGITTNESGNVIWLALGNNNLTGEIPAKLSGLAGLVGLDLSSNNLTGEIPVEMGGLAGLEGLDLNHNGLTGKVPKALGNLGNLKRLDLKSNDLTGEVPAELGGLAGLQVLDLSHNGLTGEIPAELGDLAGLERLVLWGNDLTGEVPAELGGLAGLQVLDLGSNGLTGEIPAELGGLAGLWYLDMNSNGLTGEVPAELRNLANLERLDLSSNELTAAMPEELATLANLVSLAWGDNAGLCAPGTRRFVDFAAGLQEHEGVFCHEADVSVLEVLYDLTDGPSWKSSDGWLRSGPLSDWHGVETNAVTGRVAKLDLSGNGLSGALPGSVASMAALRELRLEGNTELGGRLALGMTALPLQTLRYGDTNLCTPAEPSFRSWLRAIPSHAGNGVDCPPLTDREVLEVLYRSNGGPDWVNSDHWLTDAPLETWHGVKTDEQGRIRQLVLSENGLAGEVPDELHSLASLERLDLSNNELTGKVPAELGALANLVELSMYANGLTGEVPAGLGNLANLRDLHLGSNDLTGAVPGALGDLASLETLNLQGNSLTGQIPVELGDLGSLRRLDLSRNDLTGDVPGALGDLADLETLHLRGNGLTGKVPAQLGRLGNLQSLDLSDNELAGEVPGKLGNLGNLRTLRLDNNNLTGAVPDELGHLANLERLDLDGNVGMSGALPSTLTALGLAELLLGGTGLCVRPEDSAVRSWLRSIPRRRVRACGTRGGGSGTATAYVVQAVQSAAFPVPLVAGRPGMLRVFVSAPEAGNARMPTARATFYQDDGSVWSVEAPSGNGAVPAEPAEGSLQASANADVPGWVLRPGVEMVVVVDPGGVLDPALGVPRRIPETGRTALPVHQVPSFDVTVVPFLWETEPDSSILDVTRGMTPDDSLFEATRRLLPVGAMTVTVHDPVWTSSNSAFDLLDETEAIRTIESGGGYWMGTMQNTTPDGLLGVAAINSRTSFSRPSSGTIAHEFGHSMSLAHAPCGGAAGPDPAYPDRRGNIGAWGWDRRSGRPVPPGRKDLMGYCRFVWIGDYHFANAFRWRMHDEAGVGAFAGASTRVLLLWGGADAEGKPFLNPAFATDARPSRPERAGAWRIVGEANDGRGLFDRVFDMTETADGDGRASFVFTVPAEPAWANSLARIVLTGPGGYAEMDARTFPTAALLLDAGTGRVRGIMRDWSDPRTALPDAAGALPEPGLEVQLSRGIPAPEAWMR